MIRPGVVLSPAMRLRSLVVFLLALAVAGSALYVRRRQREAEAPTPEESVSLPSAVPGETAPASDEVPEPEDVRPTIDRLFEGTVEVDPGPRPGLLAGDFNGDALTDLAVVVRVRDAARPPELAGVEQERGRPRRSGSRAGHRARREAPGGRARCARRGLARRRAAAGLPVRSAVGSAMRTERLADLPAHLRMRVSRAHTGDVIAEVREGRPGWILWNGAAYKWADGQ
jgi:hypothetical protein